ncbi:MAG: outer membrane protein assembly factor BamA [bacterium]|jgi:outer membrane protein insertion porin family
MKKYLIIIITLFFTSINYSYSQITIGGEEDIILDYNRPKEYEIGGITVVGVRFLDNFALVKLTGLEVGDKIQVPGDKIAGAIKKLWVQGLFDDIAINIRKVDGNLIFLEVVLKERARLSRFSFSGIKKTEADEIREKIKLVSGKVLNDNLLNNTENLIRKYYAEKGYLNAKIELIQTPDSLLLNSVMLKIKIDRNERVKIAEIKITGNKELSEKKIKKLMKETKERAVYKIFTSSKYQEKLYNEDKLAIIERYNELGFRDAKIVRDTVYDVNKKELKIEMDIVEGPKYYFGNINFIGNTKYSTEMLNGILAIKKGDIYNKRTLQTRLEMNQNGRDIASLYLDDGYLFFNIDQVEKQVYNDTIDLDLIMREGPQATIDKIVVRGNEKTNDKVILREIRTKPGQKFSRSEIIRTNRELSQLGYFDPEKIGVQPKPDPVKGTVDIEYTVIERASDQIELSGGFGGGRAVGTLGLSLTNLSMNNLIKGKFDPLPTGDGQKLSIRAQTNGLFFQSYSLSFSEPWLGGKKPNFFTGSIFRTTQSNGFKRSDSRRQAIEINGVSFSLGKRLKVPDDFFLLNNSVSYQQYNLTNYGTAFVFDDGRSHNISFTNVLSRNSVDQPIYPRSGSNISLSIQFTPPFSAFTDIDYKTADNKVKYEFIEYHKWKFDASFFNRIVGDLVINTKANFGFLGYYNQDIGISPFERFKLGGDGLVGFDFLRGSEIIGLRGYQNNSIVPNENYQQIGAPIYNKFTVELRHPVTMNQSATIFALVFAEAGNTYDRFRSFNPYNNMKRSVGAGVRIFLPIFGLLGLDYGYGFDQIPGNPGAGGGQFHFSIGQQF